MLAKRYRLTKRGSFSYVYRKGAAVRERHITLVYVAAREKARIGFSVSNKVGCAVMRNKIKRRMRAVIGGYIDKIKPCQAVFCVKSDAGMLEFATVESELTALLQKSGLLINQ